jgi:ABC-type transporter Mla subunit MlaD
MAHREERSMRTFRVLLAREEDPALLTWLSSQFSVVLKRLDAIDTHLGQQDARLDLMEKNIMADLDQALADIADEKTAIGSVTELINGLRQQLADALSGASLPPAVQDKINAVFAGLEDNKAALAKALTTQPSGAPVTPAPPADGAPPASPAPSGGGL